MAQHSSISPTAARQEQQLLLCVLLALAAVPQQAVAFPTIFVARYAKECTDHPSSDFGKVHEYTKNVDKEAVFSLVTQSGGKAAGSSICAGDSYNLQVTFGGLSNRNYLLTTSHGSLSADNNDCDAWCDNRVCSKSPITQAKAVLKVPCDTAAGTQVTVKITSANGRSPTPGYTLRSNTLGLSVEGNCPGKCGGSSSSSKGSSSSASAPTSSSGSGGSSGSSGSGSGETKKVSQKKGP